MSCNISYQNGKIIKVLDDSGQPSKLYKEAVDKFGEEKGLEMYLVSKSNSFLDFFGKNEPTLQEVTNYVASNNKTDSELNKNQKADLINVLISTPNFKAEDFYDEFGMFKIPQKYYSRYELMTIDQAEVKQAIDALLNTEFTPNIEVVENALQINEKNAFGKLINLNPNIVKKEAIKAIVLSDESEVPYGAENFSEEAKSYKKADVLIETLEGEIISAKNNNTEQILPLVVKENFKTDLIDSIQNLSLNTLKQGEEQTRIVLKAIENDLISQGIDAIGLSDKSIDQDLLDYLDTTKNFINSPTKENTKIYAEKSDIYFERDTTPKKDIVKSDKTDRNYIKLNTNKTEEELYESKGLIQSELGKGIYIQTAKESLEELYNNLRTYTEKYPKDTTLEKYVQEQITKQETIYNNAENAEAIFLYKMYFGVGQNLIKDKSGNLLAPNGKISNLNEEQWKLVRTPEFKAWFGDWQNDPQNASKVVDENGEPLVVYHGSSKFYYAFDDNNKWTQFENKRFNEFRGDRRRFSHTKRGFYFGDKNTAINYANEDGVKGEIYPVFINAKTPLINNDGVTFNVEGSLIDSRRISDEDYNILVKKGIDSLISYLNNTELNEIVVFNSNQIKSATEIKGVTTEETNDIRYLIKRPQYKNATKQFTGNYRYLTEDFISDFYIDQLKEKQKNSAKYKNFYSNFEVNEKGINLLNTDDITMQQIEIYADDNLRQYSLISKQMPDLEVEETNENPRDLVINNPQTLENYKKDLFRVNEDTIILKDNVETFIKVNDEIYENVEIKGNLSIFAKIKTENEAKNYYQYNIKPPKTNIRLSDYNYLSTQEELFTSPKKYLNKEEKESVIEEEFLCNAVNVKKPNIWKIL